MESRRWLADQGLTDLLQLCNQSSADHIFYFLLLCLMGFSFLFFFVCVFLTAPNQSDVWLAGLNLLATEEKMVDDYCHCPGHWIKPSNDLLPEQGGKLSLTQLELHPNSGAVSFGVRILHFGGASTEAAFEGHAHIYWNFGGPFFLGGGPWGLMCWSAHRVTQSKNIHSLMVHFTDSCGLNIYDFRW